MERWDDKVERRRQGKEGEGGGRRWRLGGWWVMREGGGGELRWMAVPGRSRHGHSWHIGLMCVCESVCECQCVVGEGY